MSNIYVQEPPTNGKVLLVTTVGDIDIELWSKEAPKACRNFVQLCMEGYYNGTTFFRVVRNFIVQGGDPTNTGHGGESIYGKPFQDEFHSRLRFVRRGLVAMANAGPNDNGSQFFFTLAATPELSNKHTIFGRVAGNTVFNMIKLGEGAIDRDEKPISPQKIIRIEILNNPFDDIIPRNLTNKTNKEKATSNETSSKGTKNFSLLSFGEEAEEDEEEVTKVVDAFRQKGKSSHDLLNDAKLSSEPAINVTNRKRKATGNSSDNGEDMPINETVERANTDEIKPNLQEMHKHGETSEKVKGIVQKSQLFNTKEKKMMARQPQLKGKEREDATMKLFEKFKNKLEAVKKLPQNDDKGIETTEEKAEVETGFQWMNHKLQFEDKEHKVMDANVQDTERYTISDPRNPMVVRRRQKEKSETSQSKHNTEN